MQYKYIKPTNRENLTQKIQKYKNLGYKIGVWRGADNTSREFWASKHHPIFDPLKNQIFNPKLTHAVILGGISEMGNPFTCFTRVKIN